MRDSHRESGAVKPGTPGRVTYAALVGAVVTYYRRRAGLQQIELAELVGILQPGWSKVERGMVCLSLAYLPIITPRLGLDPPGFLEKVELVRRDLEEKGITIDLRPWDQRESADALNSLALLTLVEVALADE